MSSSRLLLSSSGDLTLLSRHKLALLPKFFCSHFQVGNLIWDLSFHRNSWLTPYELKSGIIGNYPQWWTYLFKTWKRGGVQLRIGEGLIKFFWSYDFSKTQLSGNFLFQEPAECYQGPSCSWSEENWNCSLSSEKRTLAEDYPKGVVIEASKMGGCVTEITTYTEHDTRVTRNS